MKKFLLSLLLLLNFTFYSCTEDYVEENGYIENVTRGCSSTKTRTPEEAIDIALEFSNAEKTRATGPSFSISTETITRQHFLDGGLNQNTSNNPLDTIMYLVKGIDNPVLVYAQNSGPTVLATFDDNNFSFLEAINNHISGIEGLIAVLSPVLDVPIITVTGEYMNGYDRWTGYFPPSTGNVTTIVEPKVQVEWSQGYPFNKYAPSNCPAGCVAIATAQAFTVTRHAQVFNGIPLNFDNLINVKNSSYEFSYPNETDTIARFIREIGFAVNMDYDEDGSSARTSNAIDLFTIGGLMNLSTNKRNIQRTLQNYNDGIVIISSRTKTDLFGFIPRGTGHCYIVDGFKKSSNDVGFMHVNYGWGPGYNGYFLENLLAPHFTDDAEYVYPHEWKFYCLYKH